MMAKSRTECTNDTWIIHKSIEPHIIKAIPQYVWIQKKIEDTKNILRSMNLN